MKKIWILLLLLLSLACLFCACDENNTPNEDNTLNEDDTPAHTHVWGEWSVTTPATCQAKGEKTRFCACGESEKYEVEIDPNAHIYDAENTCANCFHYKDEGVVFTLQGETYIITDYTGDAAEVIIPSKYKGTAVTAIEMDAFKNCISLTSITIPNSVTNIGHYAFDGCSGLERVTFGENSQLAFIGWWAFHDCSRLASITIPSGVIGISNNVFSGCSGLESITVESGNTVYHSEGNCLIETASKACMFGCKNSVIPTDGSVTSIKEGAFDACSGLTSITIPSSVTSIGEAAFSGCSGLTSIMIPSSVSSIGNNAFSGCSGLESIIVDSGNMTYHSEGNCLIETASKMLILGCKNSIIPTDGCVTNIASRAFFDCNELVSITIPAGVESIGSYAFSGCKGLVSITIPLSVTRFDWCALSHCSNLESIKFSGTEEQWNAITKIFTWNEYTGNYTITYNYTGE